MLSILSRSATSCSRIFRSPVFAIWLVNNTGLKLAGSEVDPPLWIGDIRPSFSISGISPVSKDNLNIFVSIRAILVEPLFKRHVGIPSGPGAAQFGIFLIASTTSMWSKKISDFSGLAGLRRLKASSLSPQTNERLGSFSNISSSHR